MPSRLPAALPAAPLPGAAVLPPRGRVSQLTGLTGMRGIAAWWVVLFHFREFLPAATPGWLMRWFDHGYLAVDLFFVLSGFIIAYNYLDAFPSFTWGRYLRFLGVRIARIYPLHLFMLLLFLLNPLAITLAASQAVDWTRYSPGYFLLSVLLLQNWGFTGNLAWNVPAWSISTEWMAYLLFPGIAAAARLLRGRMLALLGILVPLVALACTLDFIGEPLGGDIPRNGWIRCIGEFIAGVALYRLWACRAGGEPWRGLDRWIAAVAGLLGLALYLRLDLTEAWVLPGVWVCLVYILATEPVLITRVLSWGPIEQFGLWSYSTYLVHYFVRDWVKFLLVRDGIPASVQTACYLAGTAIASVLLYHLIEVPGRYAVRQFVTRRGPPAGG